MAIPVVKLNSGFDFPIIGLGTWLSNPGEVKRTVETAINVGYRHIDCAMVYGNEKEIGEALAMKIKDGTVTREQLFITSKLWNTYHEPDKVEDGCLQTLSDLGLDYLDLYLIHFPVAFKQKIGCTSERDENGMFITTDRDYLDTWHEMEKLVEEGLVRSIGISNFSIEMLDRIIKNSKIVPATNQVECHPYLCLKEFSKAHKERGVIITAYSPFANPAAYPGVRSNDPKLLEEPKILQVAKKYGKTPAQILLRYQIERGHATIPKTTSILRLMENINIFNFKLTDQDIKEIESLDCNGRLFKRDYCKEHKYYPF